MAELHVTCQNDSPFNFSPRNFDVRIFRTLPQNLFHTRNKKVLWKRHLVTKKILTFWKLSKEVLNQWIQLSSGHKVRCQVMILQRNSLPKVSIYSNETPTWCNTVQVLFLQSHSTCFGRQATHHQGYLKLVQRPLVHVLSLQVSHHISLLILCFRASQYKSNETPTWCNTVQVLFLQGHSTCFGRQAPIIRSI